MIYDLQKANFFKRVSAFLLDLILLMIVFTGFMYVFAQITNYDQYSGVLNEKKDEYRLVYDIEAIEERNKVTLEDFELMSEEERNKLPAADKEAMEKCIEAVLTNEEVIYAYSMTVKLIPLMISLSFLFSYVILEFIIPLLFKNGQTVGKKIFAIAVMRVDGIRVTPPVLFVRSILGKYTIETMIPAIIIFMMFLGGGSIITIGVLFLILILQIVLLIFTKTNSMIHDTLSSTVVIDLHSQMIFDSVEAKKEYQLRIHDEEAKNAKYF